MEGSTERKGLISRVRHYLDVHVSKQIIVNVQQALPLWIAALLVGFVAVGYTTLFNYGEDLLSRLMAWDARAIFVMAPLCFLIAWLLVKFFATNARGSGIPQVMASMELATPRHEHRIGMLLSLRIIFIKISSSLFMIMGGGAIGREGPTIQIAASVFRFVRQLVPRSWPRLSDQSYILTGASAGLAAAFNTPLGGIVFAIEELSKIHVRFFRTALFTGVLIAGLTAQAILGPYLYLGYPDVRGLRFSVFFAVAATAIAAGLAGSIMCRAILGVLRWKKSLRGWQLPAFVLGAGLVVAALAYFINAASLGSGKELMNEVLFTEEKASSWDTMLLRITGPVIAFNSGGAGGVFAPSLSAGASVGAFLSGVFQIDGAHANIIILSGMVGFLTGVTRTPFTSAILVLEMTDRHSVIFHLILAALISNLAALLIDKRSFYDKLKKEYVDQVLETRGGTGP
jgi:H+/Cl- antiporter ClcA